jgi:molybdopterin/thiamine biosynthesis adenylyltransferase
VRAAQAATSAPLIERSIERATGIVYNITGGKDLTLQEARLPQYPKPCSLCFSSTQGPSEEVRACSRGCLLSHAL